MIVRHFQIDPTAWTGMIELHDVTPEFMQAVCYAVVNNLPMDINGLLNTTPPVAIPLIEVESLEIVNDFERYSTFGGSSINYIPSGKKVRIEFHQKQ